MYFGKYFLTVEYGNSRRVNFSMENGFKNTCLVLNTFVNINNLYVIVMQLQSTLVISKSKGPSENTKRYPYFEISDLQS